MIRGTERILTPRLDTVESFEKHDPKSLFDGRIRTIFNDPANEILRAEIRHSESV